MPSLPFFFTEEQVRERLDWPSLLTALEAALIEYSAGRAFCPVRQVLPIPAHQAFFGLMPAIDGGIMGAKLVTVFPENAARQQPTHQGVIQLFRSDTGEPLAAMDARLITEMRTAAVSALATRLLAKPDARVLAILGSGVQARAHFQALQLVRKFEQIYVWSRTPEHASRFAEEIGAQSVSAEEAVRQADVVVTVTHSPTPVLQGQWLKPDVHVNAVGAVGPTRRELDETAFQDAVVIVESKEAAWQEAGDLLLAKAPIDAELGELLSRTKSIPPGKRTIYKSLGIGIEDLAAAKLVYGRAVLPASRLMIHQDSLVTGTVTAAFDEVDPEQTLPLSRIASLTEFEALARVRLTRMAYDHLAGGVGNEMTLRANTEAWDRLPLRPRILVDVAQVDTRIRLLGQELAHPILLAPTAYHGLYHPEGERETVRGAAASDSTLVASSYATRSIEEMARVAPASLWFQLYVERDREFTRDLVRRAEEAGCQALCVTVDQPIRGYRDRDIRNAFALPPGLERVNLRGLNEPMSRQVLVNEGIYGAAHDPTFTLRDLEWLRGIVRIPLLVKGIMTPEAAEDVIQAGVAGLIVSNHGGRSLDTVPATAEVLPAIADQVAGRVPLLVDGGIRRGTDVLKALALGAQAVLIGRPYVYALAVAGAAGISRAIDILTTELKMAMVLSGQPTVDGISRNLIWTDLSRR